MLSKSLDLFSPPDSFSRWRSKISQRQRRVPEIFCKHWSSLGIVDGKCGTFMDWACFPQIYFSYFSEELLLPVPQVSLHDELRLLRLWGTDVLWSFEMGVQPDFMSVWGLGCHERKECMLRRAYGMCSEDGSIYFNSSASFSGVCNEDLWFPYSLCSLYYCLDLVLHFHFCYSDCLGQFLSYFSVCQMFTFLGS